MFTSGVVVITCYFFAVISTQLGEIHVSCNHGKHRHLYIVNLSNCRRACMNSPPRSSIILPHIVDNYLHKISGSIIKSPILYARRTR